MLENHCATDGVVLETNHKDNCQNERKQRGEFEPIYCLFIFLKSWCNLLAHVKTDNGFVHVRMCIVTYHPPFRTHHRGSGIFRLVALLPFLKTQVIFRNCYFIVLINPVNGSKAGPLLLKR